MSATLDIVPLRSLVAVARCGGFGRAAQALHLTQSAVSQHVRRLETATGVALVERRGRTMAFTRAGEVLLVHADAILAAHDTALRAVSVQSSETVSVATTEHAADRLIPALTRLLRERLPDSRVHFRVDRSARVLAGLDDGSVDVAVFLDLIGADDDAPEIAVRWFAAADLEFTTAAELPLILFDDPCALRTPSVETLRAAGIDWRVVAESQDLAGVTAAVRAGLGVTLLPVIDGVPDGMRLVLDLPEPPPFTLRVRTGSAVPESISDAARAAVADIARQGATAHA